MWYSSITNLIELLGPSRYQWDNSFFNSEILRRISLYQSPYLALRWQEIPDKLILYDYIGGNPAKGGLFRAGPIIKSDNCMQNWVGHTRFNLEALDLYVRRILAFFETFPVVLVDTGGTIRSDIPSRRADSRYSIEQVNLTLSIAKSILNSLRSSSSPTIKFYSRKAQFGEIFSFEKKTFSSDGVFRSSARGWHSFSHSSLGILFLLGHLWHLTRALFKEIWTGLTLTFKSIDSIEYGKNEKPGF